MVGVAEMQTKILLPFLLVAGGGLLFLQLRFGSVTPCGILRAEVRQEAFREGGMGILASALPDFGVDAILEAQFGPLSPGRCLLLAVSGPGTTVRSQTQTQPNPTPEQIAEQQVRVRAAQINNLQDLSKRTSEFIEIMDTVPPKLSRVEQRYQYITRKMRGALARERSMYGGGSISVARNQISAAITQASIDLNQIHLDVQSSIQNFNSNVALLESDLADGSQGCRGPHIATSSAPVPTNFEERNAACLHLGDVSRRFHKRVSDMRAAFSHVESIWQAERQEQDKIVQDAGAAE